MSVDTVSDFLTIIRNGILASKPSVRAPYSRLKHDIAKILHQEGFIRDFSVENPDNPAQRTLKVQLKYVDGESVIHAIERVSRPGRREYAGVVKLEPVVGGLGISVVTTSRGVMTDKEAKQRGIGGEVICTVW